MKEAGAHPLRLIGVVALLSYVARDLPSTSACDCPDNHSDVPPALKGSLDNNLLTSLNSIPDDSLEDGLSPQIVQEILALNLHRIAIDIASMAKSQGCRDGPTPPSGAPCSSRAARRRSKRFTDTRAGIVDDKVASISMSRPEPVPDVPIVAGYAGLGPRSAVPLSATRRSKADDTNDVPVVKGSSEGSYVRQVTPSPTSRTSVPVVKGYQDPLHPTRRPPSVTDIKLSSEEHEALAVLLGGKRRTESSSERTPLVTRVSGKVGGRPAPTAVPVVNTQSQDSPQSGQNADCCNQKKLLQELDKQLAILRRVAEQHKQHDEWQARAMRGDPTFQNPSFPNPYSPYLHNLPIHPARGMDGYWTSRMPIHGPYFFPSSQNGYVVRRRVDPSPGRRGLVDAPVLCDAEVTPRVDGKVKFSEQQQTHEEDDMRGEGGVAADVNVDAKLDDRIDVDL